MNINGQPVSQLTLSGFNPGTSTYLIEYILPNGGGFQEASISQTTNALGSSINFVSTGQFSENPSVGFSGTGAIAQIDVDFTANPVIASWTVAGKQYTGPVAETEAGFTASTLPSTQPTSTSTTPTAPATPTPTPTTPSVSTGVVILGLVIGAFLLL